MIMKIKPIGASTVMAINRLIAGVLLNRFTPMKARSASNRPNRLCLETVTISTITNGQKTR